MSHISSRSRTQPHIRRQSMTSQLLSPIAPSKSREGVSGAISAASSPGPAAPAPGPESPPRARQDLNSFMAGSPGNALKPPSPTFPLQQRRSASVHTCTLPAAPNSAKRHITLSVEPDVFRLLDDGGKEVASYPYEHLSGVQVEGNGLALIIYKPDTPAYAYFFATESTAVVAAALEQRRRKRQQATETLTLSVPVWLRFASDSVQGKRVADALSFPAAGPLTFSDAGTAVETLGVRGLAILRTASSLEVFSMERRTLWSITSDNADDISSLFSALLQMPEPPVVSALGDKGSTAVDILLTLHAAVLKTATVSVSMSVRSTMSDGPRPASIAADKPSRLESRAQSFSPPRVTAVPLKHGHGSDGPATDKQLRRNVLADLVPQANSPLRKPTKTLIRLICKRNGYAFVDAVFQAISASSAEADRVVKGIVVLQCAMGRGGDFAAHLARMEIASLGPGEYPSLFRANSMGTKALILFCRRQGAAFFQRALRPAIAQLLDFPKPVEIDPSKDPKANLQKNATTLRTLIQQFIDGLLNSTDSMPSSVSMVMATIREEIEKRFPGKGPHAVGCLLFLRLVCPFIIAPEQFGLAPAAKITAAARRALVLVSKVIQAMLSEVQVQAKEAYMAPLDSWIGERRGVVYSYAVALSRLPETRRLQGRPPVPEPPATKEDLVGSFIGLQSTLSAQEPLVVKALADHPKDAARFSRSVKAAAAAQGAK